MNLSNWLKALTLLLALAAAWQAGNAGWIAAKAHLAQVLMDSAWDRSEGGRVPVRPWPWADTWPVAKLDLGQGEAPLVVLDGASGRNLAFGPARLSRTPWPGQGGATMLAGHRDTHFESLRALREGDIIRLERGGTVHAFQTTDLWIVHEDSAGELEQLPGESLILVTCYPFEALDPGTEWRYVIRAVPMPEEDRVRL